MHAKVSCHLRSREPAAAAKMLRQARDLVCLAELADDKATDWLPRARAKPPRTQRFGDLAVGLFGGQHGHLLDDGRRGASELGAERGRGCSSEVASQDILDSCAS